MAQIVGILQNGIEPSDRFSPYSILSSGLFIPSPFDARGVPLAEADVLGERFGPA
jgi:hypothetical protein